MNKTELKREARALAGNKLLPLILQARAELIIEAWKRESSVELRERHWQALKQLEELAGAIDAAIREHGGSRAS